ncbi:MAG: hypothetical protein AAF384_19335 [Pseudomonadota bacterium]
MIVKLVVIVAAFLVSMHLVIALYSLLDLDWRKPAHRAIIKTKILLAACLFIAVGIISHDHRPYFAAGIGFFVTTHLLHYWGLRISVMAIRWWRRKKMLVQKP